MHGMLLAGYVWAGTKFGDEKDCDDCNNNCFIHR